MRRLVLSFLVMSIIFSSYLKPCTMILVGKDATTDGSVLLAHNNDLSGEIASLFSIIPAQKHMMGEMIELKNGLNYPQASKTYHVLMMNCYYGFAKGDARAINEYQVAIAGGVSLEEDRNDNARELDPLIKDGVTGYIRYIALQRSKTARECVEFIGKMYSQYGIAYPSGVGVADPNEVWYIEAGGGKCWVAQRIPDDSYLVVANGYRIGEINLNDQKNVICPPYLRDYVLEKGLWKPGKQFFNFAKVFGGKKREEGSYYNTRRIWRVQQLLNPSFNQRTDFSLNPVTLRPDKKISVSRLIELLRDYYKGTPFDTYSANTVNSKNIERPIATFNTVHTGVIQLRSFLPPEIGAIVWGGLSSSLSTPYIPYYLGIKKIPQRFDVADSKYDTNSAYWHFHSLSELVETKFSQSAGKVSMVWSDFEKKIFSQQKEFEKKALEKYNKDKEHAKDFLTAYSTDFATSALQMVDDLYIKLKN